MTRFTKGLSVLVVAIFGIWGCAQGPSATGNQADRAKALEAKCSRLEEDYRTVAVARDQARKQSAALEQERTQWEEQRTRLQKELELQKIIVKERDRLRQDLDVRTGQRDLLQVRCDKLRTGLKSLMGEDDAMVPTPALNTSVSAPTLSGN